MNDSDEFLSSISAFQGRLFGFVLSLVGDVDQANEVLQETNLVLWKKSDEFQPGSSFKAWSFRIAHFQVMAHRQRQVRNRLVFKNDVIEQITREATEYDELYEIRKELLQDCMARLAKRDREILHDFYDQGMSMEEMSRKLNRTAAAIGQLLFRIRQKLIQCVSNQPQGATDVAG